MSREKKILYIDCFSGAAGDMLLGALLDLGASRDVVQRELEELQLKNWELEVEAGIIDGISGTDVHVRVGGVTEAELGNGHNHEHHHGRTFGVIRELIETSNITPSIREKALSVFSCLAEAEGRVHGVHPSEVHFHEVGAVDAIVDIVGVCSALESLQVDEVICAPLPLGRGFVDCAHGRFPLPGPATLEILKGCPTEGVSVEGELVTPTGAALIKVLSDRFGGYPEMTVEAIGYGLGDMRWPDRPNVLRLVLGTLSTDTELETEVVLEANLDDMNPEWFAPLTDRLFEAGAQDVWLTPIQMKKGRPGIQISIMASEEKRVTLTTMLMRESSTLGVRSHRVERFKLVRREETVETGFGPVRIKTGWDGDTRVNVAPEFEDCRAISEREGVPLKEVYLEAHRAVSERDGQEGT